MSDEKQLRLEADAFELVRVKGRSLTDAGKALGGRSKSTIRSWVTREATRREVAKRAAQQPKTVASSPAWIAAALGTPAPEVAAVAAAPAPPAQQPEDNEDEDPKDEPDALEIHRQSLRDITNAINEARLAGNLDLVQRFTRTTERIANGIRQLEKAQREDNGVIHVRAEDIARAREELRKKRDFVAALPRVCTNCGCEMRMRDAGAYADDKGEK